MTAATGGHVCSEQSTCTSKETHQIVKNVSLMDMDGDESLKLHTLNLGQVLQGLVDQTIQHLQESLVSGGHDLLVGTSVGERKLSISSPQHLDAQNTNLTG